MKRIYLTYLILFTSLLGYSQTSEKISDLENQKKNFQVEIENLMDSIKGIDLKIAKIKSKKFMGKIKDSSLTATARKGAKLKKDWNVFADIITIFEEDKKVIILDYKDGFFEVCESSLCGYMSELWIKRSNSISEFVKSKKTENEYSNGLNKNSSNYTTSSKKTTPNSTYKTKRYRSSRSYYSGPRGGCYYINSNGNKTYVARSLCH